MFAETVRAMPIDIIKPFMDLFDKTGKPAVHANGLIHTPAMSGLSSATGA